MLHTWNKYNVVSQFYTIKIIKQIIIKGRGPRLPGTLQCAAIVVKNQQRPRRSSPENWESGALETQRRVQDGGCNHGSHMLLSQTRDCQLSKLLLVVISSAPTASPVPALPHPSRLQRPATGTGCGPPSSLSIHPAVKIHLTQWSSNFDVSQSHLEGKSSTGAQPHLSSRWPYLRTLT